jgi:hypothetical protein
MAGARKTVDGVLKVPVWPPCSASTAERNETGRNGGEKTETDHPFLPVAFLFFKTRAHTMAVLRNENAYFLMMPTALVANTAQWQF